MGLLVTTQMANQAKENNDKAESCISGCTVHYIPENGILYTLMHGCWGYFYRFNCKADNAIKNDIYFN